MNRNTKIIVGAVAGTGAVAAAAALGYRYYYKGASTSAAATAAASGSFANHWWVDRVDASYIMQAEPVMFNAVDSLSVYGRSNEPVFLDVVHYVNLYCKLYLTHVQGTVDAKCIDDSSKLQTIIFNAIAILEANVSSLSAQKMLGASDFNDRSQAIISLLQAYQQNLIRQFRVY